MKPLGPKVSYFLLYSGCAIGFVGFALGSLGGVSWYDPSSHGNFLRSIQTGVEGFALLAICVAAVAVYLGRKGVIADEKRRTQKEEPNQSATDQRP